MCITPQSQENKTKLYIYLTLFQCSLPSHHNSLGVASFLKLRAGKVSEENSVIVLPSSGWEFCHLLMLPSGFRFIAKLFAQPPIFRDTQRHVIPFCAPLCSNFPLCCVKFLQNWDYLDVLLQYRSVHSFPSIFCPKKAENRYFQIILTRNVKVQVFRLVPFRLNWSRQRIFMYKELTAAAFVFT